MAIEFLSLEVCCDDYILTHSIAFFYSFFDFSLTSIVNLQKNNNILKKTVAKQFFLRYNTYVSCLLWSLPLLRIKFFSDVPYTKILKG